MRRLHERQEWEKRGKWCLQGMELLKRWIGYTKKGNTRNWLKFPCKICNFCRKHDQMVFTVKWCMLKQKRSLHTLPWLRQTKHEPKNTKTEIREGKGNVRGESSGLASIGFPVAGLGFGKAPSCRYFSRRKESSDKSFVALFLRRFTDEVLFSGRWKYSWVSYFLFKPTFLRRMTHPTPIQATISLFFIYTKSESTIPAA